MIGTLFKFPPQYKVLWAARYQRAAALLSPSGSPSPEGFGREQLHAGVCDTCPEGTTCPPTHGGSRNAWQYITTRIRETRGRDLGQNSAPLLHPPAPPTHLSLAARTPPALGSCSGSCGGGTVGDRQRFPPLPLMTFLEMGFPLPQPGGRGGGQGHAVRGAGEAGSGALRAAKQGERGVREGRGCLRH